jgi:hypothetical protein
MDGMLVPFNIYEFQSGDNIGAEPMRYNVSGIRISPAAFARLREEISLADSQLEFPRLWGNEETRFYSSLVPVGSDIFRRIVVRASRIPLVENTTFNLTQWTEQMLYEVCMNPAAYDAAEKKSAMASPD